ncbi:hypothetical protein DNTS_031628 [Danionella cerebrum]|uniref:Uncharacterized protein n=1 Tax=Danionella cerebrum TaxID=2873325 RepID=A0A553QVW9_9TELE|nr:hypothetical protein DNTS_031628 [Danionella translucida]
MISPEQSSYLNWNLEKRRVQPVLWGETGTALLEQREHSTHEESSFRPSGSRRRCRRQSSGGITLTSFTFITRFQNPDETGSERTVPSTHPEQTRIGDERDHSTNITRDAASPCSPPLTSSVQEYSVPSSSLTFTSMSFSLLRPNADQEILPRADFWET